MNKTKKKNTTSQEKEKSKSSRKPSRKNADTSVKNTRTAQPNEKQEKKTSRKPSRKRADTPVKDTRTAQPNGKQEKRTSRKPSRKSADTPVKDTRTAQPNGKQEKRTSRKPSRKSADAPVKNTQTAQPNEKQEKRTSRKPSRKRADAPVKDTQTAQPNEKREKRTSRKPSRKSADAPVKDTQTAQPNEKREKRTSHKPSRKSADAPVKDTRTTQPNEKREKAQVKKDKNNLSDNRTAVKEKKVNNKANKQTRSEQKEKKILPNRDNQKNNHNKRKQNSKKKESVYFDKYNKNKFLTDNENKNKIIKNFLATLSAEMNNELLIPANAKLLLAVSGGVDSVAMLDAVFQLAEQYRYEIIICHYNHKLRGMSSVQDEKFVRQLAKQYGLKFLVESGDVKTFAKTHSQSIEQAARTLRYNFFERMANSHQVPYLMLAHTADDSAETVLLNLLRGSGLTGLSGIPIQRTLGRKNQVIRPLMKFKKADLINYAEERELKWHEDETNSLLNFTRNKIRNVLIKDLQKEYNPQIVDTLNRTANIIRLADEFVKEHLTPYLNNFKWSKKKGLLAINIPLFESCGTFIQGEILQAKLKDKFNLGDLSQRMIERIIALPQLEVGSIIEIGKNIIALRDRRQLLFYRDRNEQFREADIFKEGEFELDSIKLKLKKVSKKQVSISNEPNIEFFDFDLVPAVLKLRTWQPGDTFTPLGMSGSMKVSDFLINQKVSLIDKNSVLVLASKSDILWVCGMRISDKFKVKSSTTRFLKVELLDKENNNEQ